MTKGKKEKRKRRKKKRKEKKLTFSRKKTLVMVLPRTLYSHRKMRQGLTCEFIEILKKKKKETNAPRAL